MNEEVQRNLEGKFHRRPPLVASRYAVHARACSRWISDRRSSCATERERHRLEHFPKSLELGRCAMIFAVVLRRHRSGCCPAYAKSWSTTTGDGPLERRVRDPELPRREPSVIYYFALEWGEYTVPDQRVDDVGAEGAARQSRSASRRWPTSPVSSRHGTMLETLQQDYIRTARAKGLRWRRVVSCHLLTNSLIPVVHAGSAARLPHHRLVHRSS